MKLSHIFTTLAASALTMFVLGGCTDTKKGAPAKPAADDHKGHVHTDGEDHDDEADHKDKEKANVKPATPPKSDEPTADPTVEPPDPLEPTADEKGGIKKGEPETPDLP